MSNKKLIYIALAIVIMIHLVFFIYSIKEVPLIGDGSFHQNIIEGTVKAKGLISTVPYSKGAYGFPRYMENYPVSYPQIYYMFGALIYPLFPDKTVYFIDLILTTILILISFVLAKKITGKDYMGIIFSTFIAVCSGLSYSSGNNNTFLLFAGICAFLMLYGWLKDNNKNYFGLFIIFSVFLLGSKQLAYFFFGGLVLFSLVYLLRKKDYKKIKFILFGVGLIIVLWAPILGYQITTTGTISTPSVNGLPIIDTYIFHPNYLNIPSWQEEIDEKVNISFLNTISATTYYEVNSRLSWVALSPIKTINQYFNFLNVTLLPKALKQSINPLLIALFFFLGLFVILNDKRKILDYLLVSVIISGFFVLFLTSRIEYFLFLPFFGLLIILLGLTYKNLNKKIIIFSIILLLSLSIIYTSLELERVSIFSNSTYMRAKTPGGFNSLLDVSKWIKENTNKTDLIMAADTQDLPYYSKRDFFWDYRLFFLNQSDLIHYLQYYPNFKYILISENQITGNFINWVNIPSNSVLLSDLEENSSLFKEVYNNNTIHIYKIK